MSKRTARTNWINSIASRRPDEQVDALRSLTHTQITGIRAHIARNMSNRYGDPTFYASKVLSVLDAMEGGY